MRFDAIQAAMPGRSGFSKGLCLLAYSSVQVLNLASATILVQVFLLGVARVELLQILGRLEYGIQPVAVVLGGELQQEVGVGVFERPLDGQGVNFFDQDGGAVLVQHPARDGWHEVLVLQNVLVPEHDVVGGEGRAVRPLHPLAQLDGPGLEIRGRGDALRQLHFDRGAVRPEAGEHVVDHTVDAVEVRGPQETAAPDAAVLADFIARNDERMLRQALLDRRQLAGLDQRCQHGRFLILTLPKAGKNTDHEKNQKQNPCSFHKYLLVNDGLVCFGESS